MRLQQQAQQAVLSSALKLAWPLPYTRQDRPQAYGFAPTLTVTRYEPYLLQIGQSQQ